MQVGFLPALVQQQLARSTHLELAAGELPPPFELQAAAIFADASGFTSLTERLTRLPDGAERMCAIMNAFLGEAIRIVHEYGGQVIKFAGDALSAIFVCGDEGDEDGAEGGGERRTMSAAVESAARCCFTLHERLHGFKAWFVDQPGWHLMASDEV